MSVPTGPSGSPDLPPPRSSARSALPPTDREAWREARRLRFRRRGRRAYIRSVYFLPSMATLGNALCGFGAIYVAALTPEQSGGDPWTSFFARHHFVVAAYLIFIAMVWDALDGRLARWTRHTTDFGGQLDSLADVISFGAAPAFLALQVFKTLGPQDIPLELSRFVWAIGALYVACAAIRLARFNVSNEHGEQSHFSFLGLPSPGAGGAVAGFVLMQQWLAGSVRTWQVQLADGLVYVLPAVVLLCGLLMVSNIRYPHVVNRYLRGRKSIWRIVGILSLLLLLLVAHQVTLGVVLLAYVLLGVAGWLWAKARRSPAEAA
ncbi:MAG: CDP-diacylglycerol--serine O-phosphatidyltransferase [Tepidisphaerales bacterium]